MPVQHLGWASWLTGILLTAGAARWCEAQSLSAAATLPLHREAAQQYRLYADRSQRQTLELHERPLFVWTNPRRAHGQVGHLFVWTDGPYPGAVGTFFSFPWSGNHARQRLVHELHSLMESKIAAVNEVATQSWQPTGGISFYPLRGSAEVPDRPALRRLRLRQLSRSFEAYTIDRDHSRWSLRMMPRELFAYEGEQRAGGVFAMLGDAGADPELLLLIEARRDGSRGGGQSWRWRYAPVRMTDQEVFLNLRGSKVWTSTHDEANTSFYNANKTYFRFPDKFYDASAMLESATAAEE